jgi:hypothetical protein
MTNRRVRQETKSSLLWAFVIFCIAVAIAVILMLLSGRGWSMDNPAWRAQKIQAEYNGDLQRLRVLKYLGAAGTLRYPNGYPNVLPGAVYHQPCCGQADAYEADDVQVIGDSIFAILTCNDPDNCQAIAGKVVRPPGMKIKIPPEKILVNQDPINDSGHGWVWISPTSTDGEGNPSVFCYTEPAGG